MHGESILFGHFEYLADGSLSITMQPRVLVLFEIHTDFSVLALANGVSSSQLDTPWKFLARNLDSFVGLVLDYF